MVFILYNRVLNKQETATEIDTSDLTWIHHSQSRSVSVRQEVVLVVGSYSWIVHLLGWVLPRRGFVVPKITQQENSLLSIWTV